MTPVSPGRNAPQQPTTLQVTASALLFDMDGTLLHSDAPMIRAYTALAQRYGLDPEHVLATSAWTLA